MFDTTEKTRAVHRGFVLGYRLLAGGISLLTLVYAAGFVGNLWVPRSLDSAIAVPFTDALLVNLALLSLFALQHSAMARPAFKRWLSQYFSEPVRHSTYVLASSLALMSLFWFWQPMGGVIWHIDDAFGRGVMHGLFAFGWLLVLLGTLRHGRHPLSPGWLVGLWATPTMTAAHLLFALVLSAYLLAAVSPLKPLHPPVGASRLRARTHPEELQR